MCTGYVSKQSLLDPLLNLPCFHFISRLTISAELLPDIRAVILKWKFWHWLVCDLILLD